LSHATASNLLSILGALTEFAGLGFVALGVVGNRKVARELERASLQQTIYVPGIESAEAFGTPTVTGSQTPTTMAQLEGMQRTLDRLRRVVEDNARTTAKEVRAEAADRANEARQEALQRHRQLQATLAEILSGDAKRELIGVILFAVGAVLSVAANIVGNL
jgi:vacuolar-type H+-ATPase subunit H